MTLPARAELPPLVAGERRAAAAPDPPGRTPSIAYGDFQGRKNFGSLDGLRALSIVGVLWHHVAAGRDLWLAEQGASGVSLFFAISGFLITTLLLREQRRTGQISLRAFYARRSLRIFPLYYAVLFVYVLATAFGEGDREARAAFFHNLPFYLTYTSNWFVKLDREHVIFYFAWSLATEEQFYVVWPSVEKWVGTRLAYAPVAIAIALIALWASVHTDVLMLDHASLARTIVLSIPPPICLGVVLAHLLHDERTFRVVAPLLARKWLSTVLLAAVIVLLLPAGLAARSAAFVAMALLVGACVVNEEHGLAPVLRSAPFASVGKVSYGTYLMHMLVVNIVVRVLLGLGIESLVVVFPLAALAIFGVAWLSFHFFESRFLALKARFVR
jgi:peptidoglycan/LPS O-acetylase OafA/YrhL